MEMTSTITCPACGHREREIMPEDACQYFYKCKGCRVVLKPRKGDAGGSPRRQRGLALGSLQLDECHGEAGLAERKR